MTGRLLLFVSSFCILLALIWDSINYMGFITAAICALLITLCAELLEISTTRYGVFVGRFGSYVIWLAKEVILSAWKVSSIAWRKNIMVKPSIDSVKTKQDSEFGMTIYANSITITPGTVTLATKDNELLVHALDVSFMDDLKSGEMEKRIKKIIRPN